MAFDPSSGYKDLFGPIAAVLAVAAGLWQFRATTRDNFINPVREAQMKLYQEVSHWCPKKAVSCLRAWSPASHGSNRMDRYNHFESAVLVAVTVARAGRAQHRPDKVAADCLRIGTCRAEENGEAQFV